MITDLFYLFAILCFVGFGISNPAIALSSVAWINIIKPQNTSFSFLLGAPLSFYLTAFFFISLFINFKKVKAPKSFLYHFLMLMFMFWITLSSIYGEFQHVLWVKYDVAIKTLIVAYFIPWVINTRSHLELFLWACSLAFGLFIMMAGIKTLLGGGGYGIALVGNSSFLYAEGSTLSTLAVSLIPIYIFLLKEAKIVKDYPKFKYVLLIYIACCIMTVIGTQARTGLIALFVFALLYLRTSKINTKTLFLLALIPVLVYTVAPTSWFERMNTINESTTSEKSAVGRLVVWRWTIDYALENPFLGGGFYAHLANAGVLDEYQAEGEVEIKNKGGKAFHNIFFEVLGEAGFGGLILFGGIITHSYLINRRKLKLKSDKLNAEEETWNRPLSFALNNSLLIYCAGGMFIGVAFYPWLYYLYCASISRINIRNTE